MNSAANSFSAYLFGSTSKNTHQGATAEVTQPVNESILILSSDNDSQIQVITNVPSNH